MQRRIERARKTRFAMVHFSSRLATPSRNPVGPGQERPHRRCATRKFSSAHLVIQPAFYTE